MMHFEKQWRLIKNLRKCFDWFYGETLGVFASFGGWIPFGPERIITK
jgi:hypothetical protein